MQKLKIKRFLVGLALFFGTTALPIFTFGFGTAATLLFQEFVFPPTLTLCRLAENPFWYDGRIVRVEADGRGGIFSRSMLIEDAGCHLPDAWSSVSLVENVRLSAETEQLFTESDSDFYKARVIVTGRFDPNTSTGCYAPKFGIKTTRIELKSEITTEPIPKRRQE